MCFSAQASFTAAAVIGVIGVASVVKAKSKLRKMAFTPLILATQQAIEGVVWLRLDIGDTTSPIAVVCTHLFFIIASMLWPLWLPAVLYGAEPEADRKWWLKVNVWIGALVATISAVTIWRLGLVAVPVNHHLHYAYIESLNAAASPLVYMILYNLVFILYLIATVGSLLLSSIRGTFWLGLILGLGWVASVIAYYQAFGSVWCYFAAWASLITFFIVKK